MSFCVCLIRVRRTPFSSTPYRVHRRCWLISPLTFSSHIRTVSTGPPTCSRYGPPALQALQAAISSHDLPRIHRSYVALVEHAQRVTDGDVGTIPFSQQHLFNLVHALGVSGRPFDLTLIDRILSDMSVVFRLKQTEEIHTVIISALVKRGNPQTTLQWLIALPRKPGHFTPTLVHWHQFLEHCCMTGQVGMIRRGISSMHKSGRKATNATFKILIRALFEYSPRPAAFQPVIDDMLRMGLPYDDTVSSLLFNGFAQRQKPQHAQLVKDLYDARFKALPNKWNNGSDRNELLAREAQKNGTQAAVDLSKVFRDEGFVSSPHTLTALLGNSQSVDELRFAERELNVDAGIAHWSILISNNVRSGNLSTALSIYAQSKQSGILPDTPMVHPVIAALCQTAFKRPSETAIDQALEIYDDLVHATIKKPSQRSTKEKVERSPRHALGPDGSIYSSLLRALASSTNVSKYFPIATSLMEDMRFRNVAMDSMTASSLTVLLMRSSSSFSEAFGVYRRMVSRADGPGIDAKGYAAILNTYTKLPFGVPSLQHYFDMVKDMRSAGHDITTDVYTILLRHLGAQATSVRVNKSWSENVHYHLLAAIRRTHDHLTLDASVSPDVALWNQLMDTYQRAGCFGEAYRIWDILYIAGTFDQASVSIILDACGFAGSWDIAAEICLKLLDVGFEFNQRNWNTWLECLCRIGKLDDALRTACLEMGKQQRRVAPDIESVRILLSFSAATNQQSEVRSRIKRYLPRLWETLPADLRGNV